MLTQLVSVFNDLIDLRIKLDGNIPVYIPVLSLALVIAAMNPFGGLTGMRIINLVAALAVCGGNEPIGWGE